MSPDTEDTGLGRCSQLLGANPKVHPVGSTLDALAEWLLFNPMESGVSGFAQRLPVVARHADSSRSLRQYHLRSKPRSPQRLKSDPSLRTGGRKVRPLADQPGILEHPEVLGDR